MKKYGPSSLDFTKTYSNLIKNSLSFENICTTEDLSNKIDVSRFSLKTWDNELFTTYLHSLIENSNIMDISNEEHIRKYSMNPQRLSKDITGITDYWYIILIINGYTSVFEFKDFTTPILFPNISYVDSLLTTIERNRSNIQ